MTAFDRIAILQALGWATLNSLWQMALLWILFNLFTGIKGSARSSQKSRLATSLLFTGFTWFLFTLVRLLIDREHNAAIISVAALPDSLNLQLNRWLSATLPYASIVYLALLILPLLQFLRNYRYVQVLRKYDLHKISVDWRIFVSKVSARIGIIKPVHIWVSDLISSPVTIGFLKPIILVPMAAVNNLTPLQMEAVLLHELAHIRRYDYLVNLFLNLVQTILYFNPFVKAFVKTVEKEREKSCDEMVIQFQYDRHHYASALLMLERNNLAARHMAIAASGRNDLLTRIERILNIEKKPTISLNKLAGVFAALLTFIMLNAVMLVSKPNTRSSSFAFEQPGSPTNLFSNEGDIETPSNTNPVKTTENNKGQIENHVRNSATPNKSGKAELAPPAVFADDEDRPSPAIHINGLTNVAIKTTVLPELNKQELKQVSLTVATTKKVMEEQQWKEVEKGIADALTTGEKEDVKAKYFKALSSVKWEKLESKLKLAYDQLNWNSINTRLTNAMTEIKLDSIQLVYTIANNSLDKAEKMADANQGNANIELPLPDVSIDQVRLSKQQVIRNLKKIKAIRNKKVIHL